MKPIQTTLKTVLPIILFVITACHSSSADLVELCVSTEPNLSEKDCECVDNRAQEELTDEEYTALINMMKDYEKDSREEGGSASGEETESIYEKDYYEHMSTLSSFLKNVENTCRGK